MTAQELAELTQYGNDSIREFINARNQPPVEFSDADLDAACDALELEGAMEPSSASHAPDVQAKAGGNHLSQDVIDIINDNLKHEGEIEDYIDGRSVDDERFPERLRGCFLNVYNKFAGGQKQLYGDSLYFGVEHALVAKPHRGKYLGQIRALLVHYFARCEVFPEIDSRRTA